MDNLRKQLQEENVRRHIRRQEAEKAISQAKRGIRKERIKAITNVVVKGARGVAKVTEKVVKVIGKKGIQYAQRRTYSIGSAPTKRFSKNLMSSFVGNAPQQANRPVGRPRAVFVHISPISGRPIPAPQYYKEMRFVRRQQSNLAMQRQMQIQQQMARQGITPQLAQQIEIQRQLQAQMSNQQQIPRPMPSNQVIPQPINNPSIWNRQGYIDEEVDALGNKRQIVRGRPESFWN